MSVHSEDAEVEDAQAPVIEDEDLPQEEEAASHVRDVVQHGAWPALTWSFAASGCLTVSLSPTVSSLIPWFIPIFVHDHSWLPTSSRWCSLSPFLALTLRKSGYGTLRLRCHTSVKVGIAASRNF